jgi:glycosyltransferase involved in cell wall biosynthesis
MHTTVGPLVLTKEIHRVCYVGGTWVAKQGTAFLGSSRFFRLNRHLLADFPEVRLLCPSTGGQTRRLEPCTLEYDLPNLQVCPLPMSGGRLWRSFRHITMIWRATGNADLICLDIPSETSFLAGLVAWLRRKPFTVRVLGDWGDAILHNASPTFVNNLKACVAEVMARFLVRHSSLVVTQGNSLHGKYARLNPDGIKADIVHSTLTADVFHEKGEEPLHNPIRAISVSGLIPLKGLDTLARALASLSSRGLVVQWWCVGDGKDREALRGLVDRLGIGSQVKFWGYVPSGPELLRLYREADIFVLPSLSEGVPLAMLEAMANSLAVIVSAVGGIPGVITDGVDGILVKPGCPDQVAQAILRLADNPSLVHKMRCAAFCKAQAYRSDILWEHQRKLLESTLGRIGLVPAS